MEKGIICTTALETVLMFATRQGFAASWSGLCVWAVPAAGKPRKGSAVDKAMRTCGFAWSSKRGAYFCRAASGAVLPSRKEFEAARSEAAA